ncbi:hypothetical protein [Aquimarina longa]|uniref:hypothetical protein n=1 Tax=Aquimarina longa TaxID=1080221 RepID=UPI000783C876|nr:hypothetical protein [Aquimarina longa]
MVIPIPSNREALTILLTIKVEWAIEVGIKVFDPKYSNTHYFRRKVSLKKGQQRNIEIPLPVSAKQLILQVYDKRNPNDSGITITDFSVEKMTPPKIWSTPERQRFMDFSVQFAQKAGYTPTGFYDSPTQEFLFQYLPAIVDSFGNELITPARTHRKMPRVQISQRLFRTFTIPIRVAILAHEGCHWFLNTRSQKRADLCGIAYYLAYGFPKIEAVYAATKIFSMYPELVGKAQVERTKDIIAFIDNYTLSQ